MAELDLNITDNFINLIRQAENADNYELKLLREQFITALNKIGAKQFVNVMADILKNKFCIEGCNDARIPLKRIFNLSLEELEKALASKDYGLSFDHPLTLLSQDHKDNIKKLKALGLFFSQIARENLVKQIVDKEKEIIDYYAELDTHIRKEEEVFFPVLEEYGMKEHPENLREEHKKFRAIFSEAAEFIKNPVKEQVFNLAEKFKAEFIPGISNHIFRETYIFYPAALEFINDTKVWDEIKERFNAKLV